jgi:HD-like signal output (HDOD) protein
MDPNVERSRERLLELVGHGIKLPTLPLISSELLGLTHQNVDAVDVHKLSALIERDQALTAAILKLVNSPYYGRSRTITHVGRALTLVGLDESLHYLNYYMMKNLLPPFPRSDDFSQESYFLHTWACATAARLLGRPQYLIRSLPGELYLAGLMHDIGKVILASHLTERFSQALRRARDEDRPLHEVERELMDLDHALLGAHLLDEWNLPASILDAVAFHHQPELASEEHQELAALTELADMIANLSGIGDGGNPAEPNVLHAWIHRHGKTRLSDVRTLERLVTEVQHTLLKQAEILHYVETEPDPEVMDDARAIARAAGADVQTSWRPSPPEQAVASPGGGAWSRFVRRIGSFLGS